MLLPEDRADGQFDFGITPSTPVVGSLLHTAYAAQMTDQVAKKRLRLVKAIYAWSAKSRRTLSGLCRGARVYGHTTTALHRLSTPHPPPPPGLPGRGKPNVLRLGIVRMLGCMV